MHFHPFILALKGKSPLQMSPKSTSTQKLTCSLLCNLTPQPQSSQKQLLFYPSNPTQIGTDTDSATPFLHSPLSFPPCFLALRESSHHLHYRHAPTCTPYPCTSIPALISISFQAFLPKPQTSCKNQTELNPPPVPHLLTLPTTVAIFLLLHHP